MFSWSTNNLEIFKSYSNFIINTKIILRCKIILKSILIYFKCRKKRQNSFYRKKNEQKVVHRISILLLL